MAEGIDLSDFRGGVSAGLAATEFSERQWSALEGLMFEPDSRLRAQWGSWPVGALPDVPNSLLEADGFLCAVLDDGRVMAAEVPAVGAGVSWEEVGSVAGGRAAAVVPLLVGSQWISGVLVNTAGTASPLSVYRDPGTGAFATQSYANRLPSGTPSEDAMPRANVAGNWGDFLILGDIVYAEDDSQPISESNQAPRRNGLWFSQPGQIDQWDPVDVQYVGQSDSDNTVMGIFQLDVGLLVLSTAGAFLYRGTAVDSEYEPLRLGVGPQDAAHAAYWPAAGVVVWTDLFGRVWHTNGQEFGALDAPLPPAAGGGPVVAVGDHMFVVRDGTLWCFHLEGENGAWTSLTVDGGVGTPTLLAADAPGVWGATGASVWGLHRDAPRGTFDGMALGSRVVTPTLATGDGHRRSGWHRFGVRAKGPGRVVGAAALPRPWRASGSDGVEYDVPSEPDDRQLRVWPGHGPSVEASFSVDMEGDVTVEGMTVWVHQGRGER